MQYGRQYVSNSLSSHVVFNLTFNPRSFHPSIHTVLFQETTTYFPPFSLLSAWFAPSQLWCIQSICFFCVCFPNFFDRLVCVTYIYFPFLSPSSSSHSSCCTSCPHPTFLSPHNDIIHLVSMWFMYGVGFCLLFLVLIWLVAIFFPYVPACFVFWCRGLTWTWSGCAVPVCHGLAYCDNTKRGSYNSADVFPGYIYSVLSGFIH